MKGLLLKDFYSARFNFILILLIGLGASAALLIYNKQGYFAFSGYTPILVTELFFFLDINELKCNWKSYSKCLPVEPVKVVLCRYIEQLTVTIVYCGAISILMFAYKMSINSFDSVEFSITVLVMLANILVSLSVYNFISFYSHKAIVYGFMSNVLLSGWFLITDAVSRIGYTTAMAKVFLVISIVLYIASLCTSIRMYKTKEY